MPSPSTTGHHTVARVEEGHKAFLRAHVGESVEYCTVLEIFGDRRENARVRFKSEKSSRIVPTCALVGVKK